MKSPIQFCLGGRSKWVGSLVFAVDTESCCHKVTVIAAICSSLGLSPRSHQVLPPSFPESSIEVKRYSARQVQKP